MSSIPGAAFSLMGNRMRKRLCFQLLDNVRRLRGMFMEIVVANYLQSHYSYMRV